MDKRIQCPICGKEGVLQWKETITKAKGKTYRYKKLYIYHWNPKKPKWCYLRKEHLEELGITKNNLTQNKHSLTQNLTQNSTNSEKPKSSSFYRNSSKYHEPRWPSWLGHRLGKAEVAGSNPARGFYMLKRHAVGRRYTLRQS